jgi:glycosyltransferase involved in cell wall biosynthesis
MNGPLSLVVVIPVYDDFASVELLTRALDSVLAASGLPSKLLLVDDGSPGAPRLRCEALRAIASVDVLRLRRNLGHQRAIAIGLAYVQANMPCDAVLVMDGDGEDRPEDVLRLAQAFAEAPAGTVVFAARKKRSESAIFTVFYHLYRALHRLLVGFGVRVGNFSLVPFSCLSTLSVASETWNHYAAAVFKTRLPHIAIPIERGTRLHGKPRMRFVDLVTHGLSAIAVFGDVVGVRLLVATLAVAAGILMPIAAALGLRLVAGQPIPAWAAIASGTLAIVLSQALAAALVFVFLVLSGRAGTSFIPIRDYPLFVGTVDRAYPSQD